MDYVRNGSDTSVRATGVALHLYASGRLTAKQARRVARGAQAAGGLVVRRRGGVAVARAVRELGFDGPVMVDPAVYEKARGADPESGDGTFEGRSSHWRAIQDELGVAAYLSPSYYVPDGQDELLDEVLADGKRFCDTLDDRPGYVVLPVDAMWLSRDCAGLAKRAAACGHRVALGLAAAYDPLDTAPKVRGLLHFLRVVPGTILFRTDVSCVGAVAHGAAGAAYGWTGGGRHVWPPGANGGPPGPPAVLVPALLRHVPIDRIEQFPHVDGALHCPVGGCDIGSIDRLAQPRYTEPDRVAHDLHVVRWLAEQVAAADDPAGMWKMLCERAWGLHERVSGLGGARLSEPRHIRAWLAAT